MASTVASLPIQATTRQAPEKISAPQATTISEWLNAMRPSWAARYAPAFEGLGVRTLAQIATMRAVELESLEAELKAHGARLVQVKQIRKAAEALAKAGKENNEGSQPSSAAICAYVDHFESPMAAYFGDGEGSLSNTLGAESPLGNITDLEDNVSMTPKGGNFNAGCSELPSRVCKESGLPFKSPMSAFFDGDDEWESIMSPKSTISIMACQPSISSTASFDSNVSTSAESAHSEASQGDGCIAPSAMKSALSMASRGKVRHISWKADVAEIGEVRAKACLCLADLVDTSALHKSALAGRMWQLSQDSKGTFDVQKYLDGCSNEEERAELVAELNGHAFQAAQCPHANHVLRKVITLMPPSALNFIVAELMCQGSQAIIELARHRFGCRIVEGLIAYCPFEQTRGMVEALLTEASALCMHMYGNFVMQRLLEQSSSISRGQLFHVMHARLSTMGTNFYGSIVLVKGMTYGTHTERLLLARAILHVDGLLAAIAKFRHGKTILELLLPVLEDLEKERAVKQLAGRPSKAHKTGRYA